VLRHDVPVSGRRRALLGSLGFFLVGPLLEAGVGPFLLTSGFSRGDGVLDGVVAQVAGGVLIVAGLGVVVSCFVRFVRDGVGTPSPLAPTRHLVVRGPYRHVRNPMYVGTAAVIVGEGLLLAQPVLLVGAVLYVVALTWLIVRSEEPQMAARFGAEYEAYRAAVGRWRPRLRGWRPPA
jgi:protein-S-isoprenylcysteine O-methyltransferase Ste14